MSQSITVNPLVQEIMKEFQLVDGKPVLSDQTLMGWLEKLKHVAPHQQQRIATELVAVAIKFDRSIGKLASEAVLQLCLLSGVVLQDSGAADAMFLASGMDMNRTRKLLGQEALRAPTLGEQKNSKESLALRLSLMSRTRV